MKKIQTKIALLLLVVTMIVALINMGVGLVITINSTKTGIKDNMLETAEVSALAAQNMVASYTNIVSEIAAHPLLTDGAPTLAEQRALLRSRAETYDMRGFGLADRSGYDAINQADVSRELFFQNALNGQAYMSTPYISEDKSDIYLVVSAPVIKAGVVDGVLYFQYDAAILQSIVESITIGEGGDAYILDRNGTTIAYSDMEAVLNQENVVAQAAENPDDRFLQELAAIEQQMVDGQTGVEEYYYEEDDSQNIQSFAPIRGTDGWSVAITINEGEYMRTVYIGNAILAILFIATFVVVLLISRIMSRSIAQPIVACAERLRTLSEGDLHSTMPDVRTRDEVGMLAQTSAALQTNMRDIIADIGQMMHEMSGGNFAVTSTNREAYQGDYQQILQAMDGLRENMSQTLARISAAADHVDSGSDQVAVNAQSLSDGATRQASSIQDLAAAVADINGYVQETDRITDEAQEQMDQTNEMTSKCNMRMKDMLSAMDDISRTSEEIGEVIKTIEDIAFQTSILALNASVEAAHAGNAGKGFAVVADEVRNLAAKSAEASKSTSALIDASANAVRRGVGLADETAQQLQSVADATQAIEKLVSDIADGARKQAAAVQQVTDGIGQISSVIQSSSASVRESAAASQNLADQAAVLKEQIGRFRLSASV